MEATCCVVVVMELVLLVCRGDMLCVVVMGLVLLVCGGDMLCCSYEAGAGSWLQLR